MKVTWYCANAWTGTSSRQRVVLTEPKRILFLLSLERRLEWLSLYTLFYNVKSWRSNKEAIWCVLGTVQGKGELSMLLRTRCSARLGRYMFKLCSFRPEEFRLVASANQSSTSLGKQENCAVMKKSVLSYTPYRQTAPKRGQVEPAAGRLSPNDREILWQVLLEPAVVEFYPEQSQRDQQVCCMINMMRGSDEGFKYFQRTHRTLFQDANFHWRRMNVFKDTFLTINMTLPTPRISGMGTGIQETSLFSLPIRNLASSFYDIVRPDWTMSLEPLELRWLPDLREFTMACPKRCGNAMPSSDKGDMVAIGDWYGFRYHVSTHRVEFTRLSKHETLETGLAGKDPLTGLSGTVVRLWIVREGEEDNSEKKGRHEWKDLCLETRLDDREMRKAWRVWRLARTRFENPVRVEPVMLFSPTW